MKNDWRGVVVLGSAILLLMALGLAAFIGGWSGRRWLGQGAVIWALVCWSAWRRLDLNRASVQAPLYPNLGWANRSTLLRGLLIAATAGFLGLELPDVLAWLPGLIYMTAAILDRLDGFIARRSGQASLLGTELDTLIDALGLVIAPLLAVSYGKLHWSFVLVSAAFYLFQVASARRKRSALPLHPLPLSPQRRALAGFVMGFLAMVLLPPFQPPVTQLLGVCFMLPVLAGFIVDWCVVSGRLKTNPEGVVQGFEHLARIREALLLPLLRLALFIGLVWLMLTGMPWWTAGTLGVGGLMIVCGAAARVGALGLLTVLAWHLGGQALSGSVVGVVSCAVGILLFGSGRWSLWQRDSEWVARHDGA